MTAPRLTVVQPKTANAADKPCQMYLDHGSARPIRTQGHHKFPQALQIRLWGEVRLHDIIWLCGTCHDNIHSYLDFLLGEQYEPPVPPFRALQQAKGVHRWYTEELEKVA